VFPYVLFLLVYTIKTFVTSIWPQESNPIRLNEDLERLLDNWDIEAMFHFTNNIDLAKSLRDYFNNILGHNFSDHTVLVTGFPIEGFDGDTDNEEYPLPRHGKVLYLKDQKLLLLTMPGAPREIASELLAQQLITKLNNMNCIQEVIPTASATRPMSNVTKQPDKSWVPGILAILLCFRSRRLRELPSIA
jgi:hypothetical protein